ncbi:GumC family protein [Brevundimonas sp.]|uniref:GumC family protein n=1 Tax=Brevundimonas sp. TaxID=1871086 RepID=UPI002FC88FF1
MGGEFGIDLTAYWRMAIKHRFLIIGVVLAAVVLATVATLLMTPIYTASTTIQIDREAARVLASEDVGPRDNIGPSQEFFETQYGLLRSTSLAERVVDSLGLATSDEFIEQMGGTPPVRKGTAAQHAAARREAAVGLAAGGLSISPVRGSRLVAISFDSPDPVLSARLANAFAENFIQANLERKFESSQYARDFLEERLAQTKSRLEESERQLVAYAANQQIINVGEVREDGSQPQSLVSSDLSALNSALAEATAARIGAEQKWRQAQSSAIMNLPEVLENGTIQRLSEERARVQAEYEQKLSIYKPDFPEMLQLKARVDELDAQIASIANGIRNSIRNQFQVAANQEAALQGRVNGLKGDVLNLRERTIQYNILQREVDTNRELYDGLLQRYKEVGITGGVTTNNVSIVDVAEAPDGPSKPSLFVNVLLAVFLGLTLGLGITLILEALDESLATPEDIESKLGVPVLGVIPLLPRGTTTGEALADIRSPFSEAYYSLRTALQFSTPDGSPATMLITSSRPGEGKSTTAYAVALNLARVGKRVLLADGDLRNPSMHRIVGVENVAGMSNLLSGAAELGEVARETRQKNLWFIPCGPLPPNPAELWGSDRMRRLLAEAGAEFDHIVIDGPPVLGLADSPMLGSMVAGVIFVLESKTTRRGQARGALKRLLIGDNRLLGAVLTKLDVRSTQYGDYNYAYDYEYGPSRSSKGGKGKNGKV